MGLSLLLNPVTGGGSGTVTTVSVVSANGFSGSVANATTTPAITLTCSLGAGIIKSNGTGGLAVASSSTDYISWGGISNPQNGDILMYSSGAWINATSSGGGDMFKATYDTDNDGRVDNAENVSDGTYSTTAAQVKTAYDNNHTHSNKATLDAITTSNLVTLDQTTPQSITGGRVTFAEGFKLGTTPTVGTFEEGKVFYDATNKTMSVMVDGDVTLQVGQEDITLVYNGTGSTILNGQVVYINGATGDTPTVALAKADAEATSNVRGMATQDIPNASTGIVTSRGKVHDLNTDAYNVGDIIYLSASVAGAFTSVDPSIADPQYESVKLGRVLLKSATTGSVELELHSHDKLASLVDVSINTPLDDQVLTYSNGTWINKAGGTVSGTNGVILYLCDDYLIPTGTGPQSIPLYELENAPCVHAEDVDTVVINNNVGNPALIDRYKYNTAIGKTSIDAGTWTFNTYNYVDTAVGVTTMPKVIYRVMDNAGTVATGTVTITGTGTSRTATITGGTPFVSGDANSNKSLAGALETPNGIFQITGYTSSSVVTILTLSTYTNESAVAYSVHRWLFKTSGIEINNTTVSLNTTITTQQAFTVEATDKLAVAYFAETSRNGDVSASLVHSGSEHASSITTPFIVKHNSLPGLNDGDYKHLTAAQLTVVQNTSGTNTGDQVGDGVTITGAGTVGDPFVAVGGGSGDVTGPASATEDNFASFNGTTGKIIKDSSYNASSFQQPLVSGTNIKTINSQSLLGSGDLSIGMSIGNGVTSGTSGSVLYVDGSGNLAQENATFFYNATQNQLGVGANTFLADGNKLNCTGTSTGVIQTNCQNQSNGTSASSDLVATADTGTDSTNFVDVGINSSTYNDAAYSIGGALSSYLLANGGDLSIGTATASKVIKLHTGGTTSAQLRVTIDDTRMTVVGDITTPNVILGYTTTATAAGTTTLTNTSNYHQFFTGTTTQTVILPNATTLTLGHAFRIDNNSTGAVTIQTNGGATLFVAAGSTDTELICTGVGTAAGTWNIFYYGTEGINSSEQYIVLSGTNTLTSQTAAQPIFDSVGAGQITVGGATMYQFECFVSMTSLSSTSGSFGFALGGTATYTSLSWNSMGNKTASLGTAAALSGSVYTTTANTAIVLAGTATSGWFKVTGTIRVNAGGTIIPQVSLGTAAAAVVGANSYFRMWKVGTNTTTTIGAWS